MNIGILKLKGPLGVMRRGQYLPSRININYLFYLNFTKV